MRATKEALGWDPDKHVLRAGRGTRALNGVERGIELERRGSSASRRWSEAFPAEREAGTPRGRGRIGAWTPPEFEAGEEIATREAGKKVMQAFKHAVPTMVGGAADLVESTKTEFEGGGALLATAGPAATSPFGIREHAMGSIVNGIARARRDASSRTARRS